MVINLLAMSRWVLVVSGQSYRSGYRHDGRAVDREGSYRSFGYVQDRGYGSDSRARYNDDGYGRRADTCPYENREKNYKKKREAHTTDDEEGILKERSAGNSSILLDRLRRHYDIRYYDARDDRYRDDQYRDDRYRDDRYREDRYREDRYRDDRYRYDQYRDDRYRDDQYRDGGYRDDRYYRDRYNDRGRAGLDRCGRRVCNWQAELECDMSMLEVRSYRGGRVRWDRENDAYYPRDKYRDIEQYFGSRARVEDAGNGNYRDYRDGDISRLIIYEVRPEDKGVYRCYLEGGDEADFLEIHFDPMYPLDDNDSC